MTRDQAARVRPVADHVLVETLPEDAVSAGGIVIPEAAKAPPTRARVLRAADPGTFVRKGRAIPGKGRAKTMRVHESVVKPDDVILCLGYEQILYDPRTPGRGGEIRLIREEHILGVIE